MEKPRNTLWIIYTAFVFSSLVYLVVGFALSKAGWNPVLSGDSLPQILFILFSVICVVFLAIAFRIQPKADDPKPLSRWILRFALCEVPAILGLVLFFLSGRFFHVLVLCAFSVFAFLMLRPQNSTNH